MLEFYFLSKEFISSSVKFSREVQLNLSHSKASTGFIDGTPIMPQQKLVRIFQHGQAAVKALC